MVTSKKSPKKTSKKAVRKSAKKSPRKTVKKATRKVVKKTVKKPVKQESSTPSVVGLIALVVLAVLLLYFGVTSLMGSQDAPDVIVAATVNGLEITTTQLETQYAILPEQYKAIYTKDMILQQLIDEEILISYGRELGLTASEEVVNEEIQQILANGQLTIIELQANLEQFNLTIEDFENLIERKILIELSMASLLENQQAVTDADARAYYEANAAQYIEEEQVRARHILIASTRDDAAQFSKDLMEKVQNGADFCNFVEKETDDKGSVETCGEYTFARGFMVPEFEKASFDMAPGEMTIVQTAFGYHIIEKLEDIAARNVPFEEVKNDIVLSLSQEEQVTVYTEFLDARKAESDIQVFFKSS